MLNITVELLAGVYRADPDGGAMMGETNMGEWPPSPARLLAAFIAADGTRERCTATTGAELEMLAAAPPPTIHADPGPCTEEELHSPVAERFVVAAGSAKSTVQEFPGRIFIPKRSGARVAPRLRFVRFLYDIDCDRDSLAALRYRAARIGYLGCSDSPVRVVVSDSEPCDTLMLAEFVPDELGSLQVNTHMDGDVARWDVLFDQSRDRSRNPVVRRGHHRGLRHLTRYRLPGVDSEPEENRGRVVGWLRFGRAISGRRVVVVADRLKDAVLSQYQRLHGETQPPPPILHGHRPGQGFNLVRFLPLPNVGHRHSDGRIHGAAVWLPPDVGRVEEARITRAVLAVDWIGIDGVRIVVESWDDRPSGRLWATNPYRWHSDQLFEKQLWASAFPVVLERHGPVTLSVMDRMCANAGLPSVAFFRESRVSFISGGVQLAPSETVRPGHSQRRPYSHFLIRFDEPAFGPVVIGAGRSYGLGLCAPVKIEDFAHIEGIRQ